MDKIVMHVGAGINVSLRQIKHVVKSSNSSTLDYHVVVSHCPTP